MIAFVSGVVKFLIYFIAALKAIPVVILAFGVLWILHEL